MQFSVNGQAHEVRLGRETWQLDGAPAPLVRVTRTACGGSWAFVGWQGSTCVRWWATLLDDGNWAITGAGGVRQIVNTRAGLAGRAESFGPLKSPMAGILTGLFVAVGQVVAVGEELAIVEAMKMRFSVTASTAGRVSAVSATVGDRVTAGQALLTLDLLRIE